VPRWACGSAVPNLVIIVSSHGVRQPQRPGVAGVPFCWLIAAAVEGPDQPVLRPVADGLSASEIGGSAAGALSSANPHCVLLTLNLFKTVT
jgi:hypothetical protein